MKILAIRMENHSLCLSPEWKTIHSAFPLSLAYYLYFHSLLTAPTYEPPPKHCFHKQLRIAFLPGRERGSYRCKVIVSPIRYSTGCMKLLLVFINVPLPTSSLVHILVQTSNHSPKNYGRNMHANRTSANSQSN